MRTPPRWIFPAVCVVCVAAVLGLYSSTLDNPFVYDDHVTVERNLTIRTPGNFKGLVLRDVFRPMVNLSYALDYSLSELDPRAYHRTNIALHLLNVLLAVGLGRRLARTAFESSKTKEPEWRALGVASVVGALMAVHPMLTESVGYVSARSELLSLFFLLLSFTFFESFLASRRNWLWGLAGGFFFFILSLASKESAAMAPFLLLAWDHLMLGESVPGVRRRLLHFHLPFITVIGLAGVARIGIFVVVERGVHLASWWENLIVEAAVVWRYIGLFFVPLEQSIVHDVRAPSGPFDPGYLVAAVALLGACSALWFKRRKAPLAVFGAAWFLLLLAPSHLIPLSEAMAEHRTYGASFGLFLAVAAVVGPWVSSCRGSKMTRAAGAVAVLVSVFLLSGMTFRRNAVWGNEVTLWTDAAAKAPDTWAAQYGAAESLRRSRRFEEAIGVYQRAVALLPEQVDARLNLGICLAETGRYREAHEAFSEVVVRAPNNPKGYNNLGLLAMMLEQPRAAEDIFKQALVRDPKNVRARRLLARLYLRVLSEPAEALKICRELAELAPGPETAACIEESRARVNGR